MTKSTEETLDIENTGSAASLLLKGATLIGIHVRGDATASYAIDVRKRGGSWIQDITSGYSGSANYDDVIEQPAHELRVRCSSGTANAGDQATVTLIAD
ncbi:hypothetical protein ACFR97_10245 [Haloplanus litoreus]|uniref:CARDB protein n=1 Tax=Haloplanus litoreus TaxID=767515 RepID=A0ABD6A2C5_9EURY